MWLCNLVFATFTLPILICLVPLTPLRPLLRKKKKKKLHKYCFQYFLGSLLIPRRNWKQRMSNTFGGWTRCFMGKTKVVNRMPALALLRQYYNKKISPPKFASIDHSWVAPSFHFKARLIVWNVSLLQPLTRGAQGRETLETAGISDYKIKYEAIDIKMIFYYYFAIKSHNISLEKFCNWPCIESESFCNSKMACYTRLTELEKRNSDSCFFLLKVICISLWRVCCKIILYKWQMY